MTYTSTSVKLTLPSIFCCFESIVWEEGRCFQEDSSSISAFLQNSVVTCWFIRPNGSTETIGCCIISKRGHRPYIIHHLPTYLDPCLDCGVVLVGSILHSLDTVRFNCAVSLLAPCFRIYKQRESTNTSQTRDEWGSEWSSQTHWFRWWW